MGTERLRAGESAALSGEVIRLPRPPGCLDDLLERPLLDSGLIPLLLQLEPGLLLQATSPACSGCLSAQADDYRGQKSAFPASILATDKVYERS